MASGFFDFHEQVTRRRKPAPAIESAPAPRKTGKEDKLEPITVSQLTARIDRTLKEHISETLFVLGEISNLKTHQGSGHLYFTLKDSRACINCVMWKSDAVRLKFTPEDGMELVARGTIGVYPAKGAYQLYVNSLKPIGQGALELAFQQLRAKLDAEGLFAPERKKPLPAYPMNVVLVTSEQAAALHDMLKVLRRFTWLRLMLFPVPVQGDGAGRRVAAAIGHVNRRGQSLGAEVILLARGGGSLEDLWAFNEECVARAIVASSIPVVTGIGHEVDVSIADLVADYHAHTPTEAAQIVTQQWRNVRDELGVSHKRLHRAFRSRLHDARHRLRSIERHEAFRRPLDRIHNFRQLLDDRQRALTMSMSDRVHASRAQVQELSVRLDGKLPARIRSLRDTLNKTQQAIDARMGQRLRQWAERVARLSALLAECHPRYRLKLRAEKVESLSQRLDRSMSTELSGHRQRVDALGRQLLALSPENVLRRGFTLTMRKKDGAILRSAEQIKPGDRLVTRFSDGEVESIAQDPKQLPLFE